MYAAELPALDTVRKVAPSATHVESVEASPAVFRVRNDEKLPGYFVDTRALPDIPRGYAGRIHLLVYASSVTSSVQVSVLENRETPSYIRRVLQHVTWFSVVEKSSEELASRTDVDTVTGATYTSRAMQETLSTAAKVLYDVMQSEEKKVNDVTENLPEVNEEKDISIVETNTVIQGVTASKNTSESPFHVNRALIVIACVYAIVIFCRLNSLFRFWIVRWGIRVVVVALLGLYTFSYFSMSHLALILRGQLPAFDRIEWYIIVAFALLSPFVFGRLYCRWLYPFGVASDIAHACVPVSYPVPPKVMKVIKWIKYIGLAVVIISILAIPAWDAAYAEPFQGVFSPARPIIYLVLAIGIFLVSCFVKRFWCTVFCIDGALFELLIGVRKHIKRMVRK